jgi:hypothetical protein
MNSIAENPRGIVAPWSPTKAALIGGLIAGACDMTYALLWFGGVKGAPLIKIPQSVAGGLIGRATYDGGVGTVVLGLALHWLIACIWAAIYVYAGRRVVPDLLRKPIPCGLAYGAWIYFCMNWIVLPLDAMHTKPHFAPLDTWLTGLAVHVLGIGLAISLSAAKTEPRL